MTRDVDEVALVFWNPHAGNTAARILDRLDAETKPRRLDAETKPRRPLAFGLCEVWRHHSELEAWARRNGYLIFHERPRPRRDGQPIPGEGDVALLLDERQLLGGDVLKHRPVRMTKPWRVFSHDQPREPRIYERAWFRTAYGSRRRHKLTVSHWPTNGFEGGNRGAFHESATEAAKALLRKLPGTISTDLGDHNESVKRLREWASHELLGAVVVGHGPDSVITLGATPRLDVGPEDGSDHNLIRVRLTPRRPRWMGWRR